MSYTFKRTTPKTKPNDICPCGCGKKFKKCESSKVASTTPRNLMKGFDGHFWVVRDGRISDPYVKEYDNIKRINDLEGEPQYLPAPQSVQDDFIKSLTDYHLSIFGDLASSLRDAKRLGWKPFCGGCQNTALYESLENGGQIVFGSMGWKKKNSSKIWWEYGGADWTNTEDFVKVNHQILNDRSKKQVAEGIMNMLNKVQRGELTMEEVIAMSFA